MDGLKAIKSQSIIYFPGLNGLRAIAAIAVVISHITLNLKEFGLDPYIFGAFSDGKPQGLSLAGYGVSIFFVLSGFLITYLLQAEKEIQSINITYFYIRRILRIWPLYYCYFFLTLLVLYIYNIETHTQSIPYYLFFAPNIPFILSNELLFVGHFWSLGVEEQFYFFWPWLNKKVTALPKLVIMLIMILIGTKLILHFFFPSSILELCIHVTRFHCMLIGALGALYYKKNNLAFLKVVNNKLTQSICWLIILLVLINKYHVVSVMDNEIISVVALLIIIGQIEVKNRIVNLEIPALNFLGKISYGIYVIHPLLIFFYSKIFLSLDVNPYFKYLMVYSCIISSTLLISYLSYAYLEKYFLKFKNKFMIVKSSPDFKM